MELGAFLRAHDGEEPPSLSGAPGTSSNASGTSPDAACTPSDAAPPSSDALHSLPDWALSVVGLLRLVRALEPVRLPLIGSRADCGFPSPADDYVDRLLSLDDLVIINPAATFLVRSAGDSMVEEGIEPGDLLVVDRSLQAASGHIVVAIVDGEMTVKRLHVARNGAIRLVPASPCYAPIRITREMDFEIWGVVTFVLKKKR